eukprot:comp18828_c0_seq1/m.20819 comp18828_c0_seq1/g.20819  ORF comp18828_c0_seq1/g.20819 comp18828_c0_seq1/m.20819 type:complete len:295 (-) comp18828_c0_seq1:373-1257(-)
MSRFSSLCHLATPFVGYSYPKSTHVLSSWGLRSLHTARLQRAKLEKDLTKTTLLSQQCKRCLHSSTPRPQQDSYPPPPPDLRDVKPSQAQLARFLTLSPRAWFHRLRAKMCIAYIKRQEPDFSVEEFLEGAKHALRVVTEHISNRDLDALQPLLDEELYDTLSIAAQSAQDRGDQFKVHIGEIHQAEIVDARMIMETEMNINVDRSQQDMFSGSSKTSKKRIELSVMFLSLERMEFIFGTKTEDGKPSEDAPADEGSFEAPPTGPTFNVRHWTFRRDIRTSDGADTQWRVVNMF